MAEENTCIALQDIGDDINCKDNAGGITTVLLAYHQDVASWPDEPESPADIEAFGKLTGDLVMKTGKKMSKFELTPDKGGFTITEIGETGGKSHQMELEIYRAGLNAKVLGLMGATKNAKMVALVSDPNGNWFLMGDKDNGMYRNGGDGAKTGSARSELAGTSMKFIYPVNNPRMYTGDTTAVLTPAAE